MVLVRNLIVVFAALALAAFGLVRAALEWRRLTG